MEQVRGERRFGDAAEMKTLHVIVRDPKDRIGYQPIGRAIVAAAIDEKVTTSALRRGLAALAFYQAYSPREAAEAMRTLAQLGDVDFDESDFVPQWFQPGQGIATIDVILERAGRRFPATVRSELVQLREALAEARSRSCRFYLVEMEPGEPLRGATPLRMAASRATKGNRRSRSANVRPAKSTLRCTRRRPRRSRAAGGAGERQRWADRTKALRLSQTVCPVPGAPSVVRDSQDANRTLRQEIHDAIGKPSDRNGANGEADGYTRYGRAGSRKANREIDRCVDGVEELGAEARPLLLVPTACAPILGVGLGLESDPGAHGRRRSASARRRTSSQGTPCDSPAKTRRARRSISSAQAASTAAGSESGSSRLASNSAATSARSLGGQVKASRRSTCTLEVISPL